MFRQNGEKNKTKKYSEQQFAGQKWLVDERSQRRKARLVGAKRNVFIAQKNTDSEKHLRMPKTSHFEANRLQ